MERLREDVIQKRLQENPNWKLMDEKWIERKYRFKDYLNGIDFVSKIAQVSEEMNHHPFISIDYKLVSIKITSWNAKGVTELDFALAKKYDEIYMQVKKE